MGTSRQTVMFLGTYCLSVRGKNMFHRNVGVYLQVYMALQPIRQTPAVIIVQSWKDVFLSLISKTQAGK
jgi:hypothetical protein